MGAGAFFAKLPGVPPPAHPSLHLTGLLLLAVSGVACLPSPYVPPGGDAEADAGDESLPPSAPGQTSTPEDDAGETNDAAATPSVPPRDSGAVLPPVAHSGDGGTPGAVVPAPEAGTLRDAASADGAPGAQPAQPIRIMVMGDSISQGQDGDFSWRYRLQEHLRAQGVAFDFRGPRTGPKEGSYAVAGWDTDHASLWGDSITAELPNITSLISTYEPQLLLVELGINDLVFLGLDAVQAVEALGKLIDGARGVNPALKVVVAQVERSQTLKVALWTDFNARLAAWAAKATRSEAPVVVAPVGDVFQFSTDSRDGTHPNVRGEYVYAKTFADVLAKELGIGAPFGDIPLPPPPPLPSSIVPSSTSVALGQAFSVTVEPGAGADDSLQYQLQLHNAFSFGFEQLWGSAFVASKQITYTGPMIPKPGVYDLAIAVRDREGQVRQSAPVSIEAHQ
jgi:lysophospholipase L1-like esterase